MPSRRCTRRGDALPRDAVYRTPMSTETLQIDSWVWGRESIVWGFEPDHKYTLKILEPKLGRDGCMSLQFHHQKSETWFVLRGVIWALFVIDGEVVTKLMRKGDIQNISPGMIHRLCGVSSDALVLEPSTPDEHAADKKKPKDVVRLHCVHGRAVTAPQSELEKTVLIECARITDEALDSIAQGKEPREYNPAKLLGRGAHHVEM